jgi:glycosyltransferase involved in cell wall biosynthesis
MKHITVLVSNDLQHDQRVAKVCGTLRDLGFDLTLVGRELPNSPAYVGPFSVVRFRLLFQRGVLFYLALNFRLFCYLLFKRTDIILANDLDTLLPAFLVSKLRGKELVYDSHEYFTEAEGLTGRPFQKGVWLNLERWIFPKLKHVITVNESIASIYRELYKVKVHVVRNVPKQVDSVKQSQPTRSALELPVDKTIVLLQGSYIDPDRGGMELVQAFQHLPNALLLVIGSGRDYHNMQLVGKNLALTNVRFMGRMDYDRLQQYTAVADIGVSLDKPIHLNYKYSLPNKLFDYIHAGIPVLVSDLPELRKIVEAYHVGEIVDRIEPFNIAQAILNMSNQNRQMVWRKNTKLAQSELNWQKESTVLKEIYSPLLK